MTAPVPRDVVWTFVQQVPTVPVGDGLTVRMNCPGVLTWSVEGGQSTESVIPRVGGAMAGLGRYQITLGPFPLPTTLKFMLG